MNAAPNLLALVEVMDGDQVRQAFPVHARPDGEPPLPLRLGRALHSDIVLDDPHLAAEHALLQVDAQGARLSLLPSLNGAMQGRRHWRAGEQLEWPSDGLLQLGHTRLRLRHAAAPLAPEKPMLHAPRWLGLLLLAALLLVLTAWDTWVGQDPGAPWMAFLAPVLSVGAMLVTWAALWALASQLFQRRFPFALHLRKVMLFLLAVLVCVELLPALAFVASAPWLLLPAKLLPIFGGVALVWWHAREVWPRARRVLGWVLLGGTLLWLMNGWTRQEALQHRWREPYLSTVLPPGLRAAPLRSVEALLQDAAQLREPLKDKASKDENGEDEEGGEEG
ncbi:FHA domain-containing protein [Inhella sp.]|uniref:FHA domain-containing protein n=1 Tax=Inhella sp. TaxID=1921806 RepID=UPI0035B4F832